MSVRVRGARRIVGVAAAWAWLVLGCASTAPTERAIVLESERFT
jgi:hypothetical protein